MAVTPYQLAERFVGLAEVPGPASNPHILAMLRLDDDWPKGDDVPWCSAFMNFIAWLARAPRSKSLRARSWLNVGLPIPLDDANPGYEVVILKRGSGRQPGPDVIEAPGHVGWYAGRDGGNILLLGGNQGDEVNIRSYKSSRLLGVRRLGTSLDPRLRVA